MLSHIFLDIFLVMYTVMLTLRLSNNIPRKKWYHSEKVDQFVRDIGYMSAGAFFTLWLIS